MCRTSIEPCRSGKTSPWASRTSRRWSASTRSSPPPSSSGGPPMWWTYIRRRPGPAHGVPGVRRNRLAVSDFRAACIPGRAVSSASAGHGWPAGSTPGPCAAPWPAWRTGVAPFLAQLFGVDSTPVATTIIAIALIVMTTLLNLSGTRLLARVAMFGFICELVGAIVVGGYLLLFARHQPLKVLLDTSHRAHARQLPAGLSRLLARRDVLLLRLRGLRRCGRGNARTRAGRFPKPCA